MAEMRQNARLRIVHAAVGAPSVDVQLDKKPVVHNLGFGSASEYLSITPGDHSATVFPAGMSGPGQEVLTGELEDVKADQDYTLAVLGRSPDVHAKVLYDTTAIPTGNQAKVRVLHASPDAPAVDIAVSGVVLFNSIRFREATDFVEAPAGTVDLEVRPAGSTKSVLQVPAYTLTAGSIYTFVALGLLQGTPALTVLPLVTVGEPVVTV